MDFTCLVKKEGEQYASLCVELDVASCGGTEAEALEGLKYAIETYLEFMKDEGRENDIYRPVPMNELKDFLFPDPGIKEYTLKAIPLELKHA
jgi:predicted RNase H-like HicB family nuclease